MLNDPTLKIYKINRFQLQINLILAYTFFFDKKFDKIHEVNNTKIESCYHILSLPLIWGTLW